MNPKETYEKNKMEKAYILSNYFSNILSFKDALELSKAESDFLFEKMEEETDNINEVVDNIVEGDVYNKHLENNEGIKINKLLDS